MTGESSGHPDISTDVKRDKRTINALEPDRAGKDILSHHSTKLNHYSDKQYIRQAVEKAARGTGGDTKGKKSRGEDPKRELKRRGKKMRRQEGDIR